MVITKLAACVAAVLWVAGWPAVAASALFVAAVSAAMDFAVLRHTPADTPARREPAAAAPTAAPATGSPAPAGMVAYQGPLVFGATPYVPNMGNRSEAHPGTAHDTARATAERVDTKTALLRTSLQEGQAVPVAPVAMAPGMLESPANVEEAAPAAQAPEAPAAVPPANDALLTDTDSTAADASSLAISTASHAMADDGWASVPPGGY